jgi:FixJ family two-component response regulator
MEAGAAGFLAKPFSAQEFTGLVGQVIGSPRD